MSKEQQEFNEKTKVETAETDTASEKRALRRARRNRRTYRNGGSMIRIKTLGI